MHTQRRQVSVARTEESPSDKKAMVTDLSILRFALQLSHWRYGNWRLCRDLTS